MFISAGTSEPMCLMTSKQVPIDRTYKIYNSITQLKLIIQNLHMIIASAYKCENTVFSL